MFRSKLNSVNVNLPKKPNYNYAYPTGQDKTPRVVSVPNIFSLLPHQVTHVKSRSPDRGPLITVLDDWTEFCQLGHPTVPSNIWPSSHDRSAGFRFVLRRMLNFFRTQSRSALPQMCLSSFWRQWGDPSRTGTRFYGRIFTAVQLHGGPTPMGGDELLNLSK